MTNDAVTDTRWRWVLLVGTAVAVLTYLLMYLVVTTYVASVSILTLGELDPTRLAQFTSFVEDWGMSVLHLSLTFGAAYWLARRSDGAEILQGTLVGLAATLVNQAIGLSFGPLAFDELRAFLVLGLCGGLLGSVVGRIVRTRREALYEALYRASRAASLAQSFGGITAAIGEHLADADVAGVTLWRTTPQPDEGTPAGIANELPTLLAAWAPPGGAVWPAEACPGAPWSAVFASLDGRSYLTLRTEQIPELDRSVWHPQGVRTLLLLPLISTGGVRAGMLVVASRRTRGFSRQTVRGYLTIAAQAALAVENVRLLKEVRRAGRRAGVLEERQRLAREIHDTLAQGFTSIVMNLEAAEGARPSAPSGVQTYLDYARRTARESLSEARRLVWALRPEALENSSLSEAISGLARRWSEESGISCEVTVTGTPRPLPTSIENVLHRVTQEALSNVRKHARADRVVLTLSYMGGLVILDVRDDGVGFDATKHSSMAPGAVDGSAGGFGLGAMRGRVEQVGGTLVVESSPGRGTALVVELPATDQQEQEGPRATAMEVL